MVVVAVDTYDFIIMCGTIASHHDTAMAHAMLHAVAVWMDTRGVRGTPGGSADIPAPSGGHRGGA